MIAGCISCTSTALPSVSAAARSATLFLLGRLLRGGRGGRRCALLLLRHPLLCRSLLLRLRGLLLCLSRLLLRPCGSLLRRGLLSGRVLRLLRRRLLLCPQRGRLLLRCLLLGPVRCGLLLCHGLLLRCCLLLRGLPGWRLLLLRAILSAWAVSRTALAA